MVTTTAAIKHNACGIIVSTNYADKADLLAFLATIESCNIINSYKYTIGGNYRRHNYQKCIRDNDAHQSATNGPRCDID